MRRADNLATFMCGNVGNLVETSGPVQNSTRIALPDHDKSVVKSW